MEAIRGDGVERYVPIRTEIEGLGCILCGCTAATLALFRKATGHEIRGAPDADQMLAMSARLVAVGVAKIAVPITLFTVYKLISK